MFYGKYRDNADFNVAWNRHMQKIDRSTVVHVEH